MTERLVAEAMVTRPVTHGPESRLAKIRAFFEDEHVHMALIVAADGRLVTTIERSDLPAAMPGAAPAAKLGTLTGRTAGPADPLDAATAMLLRERRRRLAVVDASGRLLGLLCLKRDGAGYCSDEGIRERAQHGAQPRQAGGGRAAASGGRTAYASWASPNGHPRRSEGGGP